MGAAIHKSLERQNTDFDKHLWLLVFPLYCISMILSVVSIIIPVHPILLSALRDLLIFSYMFSMLLYGLSNYYQQKSYERLLLNRHAIN